MARRSAAFVAAAGASVLFSAHYLIARRVMIDVAPLALAAMRGVVGGLLLLAWSARELGRLDARTALRLVPIALFGFGLNQVCFMLGLARSTPTEAALLSQAIPLFAALAGLVLLRERPSRSAWAGLALGFVALASYFAVRFDLQLGDHLAGNALIVLNVASFAISLALARALLSEHPVPLVTGGMLLVGGLGLAVLSRDELRAFFAHGWPTAELAALLVFELVVSTAIAWLASFYAVKHLSLGESSIFVYAQVPVTALLSLAAGGTIGVGELVLCPVVLLAAYLVRRQPVTA